MKIVVVSPHRDDAAFSLALSIGAWVRAGHKVVVVNCFSRSGTAPYAEMDFVHANDRISFVTALRGREDESWRKMYGSAVTLVDLNMKDAPQRLHVPAKDVYGLTFHPEDKALVKIRKALERVAAHVVVLPLGLGEHVDHVMARVAGVAQMTDGMAVGFYEDLPAAMNVESIETKVGELKLGLTPQMAGDVMNIEAALKEKRRAVLRYDSQVSDAEAEGIALFCRRYEGRERLWVSAAWIEGGMNENRS